MDAEPRRAFGRAAWLSLAGIVIGLVLLLQACLTTRETTAPSLAAPAHLSSSEALAPFFDALYALEGNAARQPVLVLQIGDSHTANDSLSGRLREQLQGRFGAAGRGWLIAALASRPSGIPVWSLGLTCCQPFSVTVTRCGR